MTRSKTNLVQEPRFQIHAIEEELDLLKDILVEAKVKEEVKIFPRKSEFGESNHAWMTDFGVTLAGRNPFVTTLAGIAGYFRMMEKMLQH